MPLGTCGGEPLWIVLKEKFAVKEVARREVAGDTFGKVRGNSGKSREFPEALGKSDSGSQQLTRKTCDSTIWLRELQFREERSKKWMPHRVAVAVSSHATPHSEDLLPGTSTRTAP